ncbi:hypothetical protein P691DRAFT_778419 [Macrolepiota fuliginosa MF-IS2]|uniref:Secreted protein n=1 Tax=Macrolepiota fuliginosa MF-IS2 TaxID=1400762 RepID=A0A9P5X5V3_9AGAR|nr:hypothetical protein P691DRAFT_778419 [Macrolepiota fuliginosa MF-IS2]
MILVRPPFFFFIFMLCVCGMVAKVWAVDCTYICPDPMKRYVLAPSDPDKDNLLRCVYEDPENRSQQPAPGSGHLACSYSTIDGTFKQREVNGVAVSETGDCRTQLKCIEPDQD